MFRFFYALWDCQLSGFCFLVVAVPLVILCFTLEAQAFVASIFLIAEHKFTAEDYCTSLIRHQQAL